MSEDQVSALQWRQQFELWGFVQHINPEEIFTPRNGDETMSRKRLALRVKERYCLDKNTSRERAIEISN